MQSALGSSVVATLVAPGVLPEYPVGARIEVPVTRAIVAYWRQAAYDPVTGLWTVVLDSPFEVGEYNLVWRDSGPEPPQLEVFVPLSVVPAGLAGGASPVEGPYDWAPTLEEVASVTPAYTRGGFDDDRPSAGAERGTYDATTEPTADEVTDKIATVCGEIAGQVGVAIPARYFGLAKATAMQRIKADIAADKVPQGTDDASGEYRGAIARYLSNLEQLTTLSRAATAPRLR